MTDPGGLQHSLAAMGLAEMALALFCLICYCLVLNAALSPNVRCVAGALALVAAAALVVATEPWTNGFILVALGVAAIGAFVLAAWAVSAACGLAAEAEESRPAALPAAVTAGRTAPMALASRLKTPR